MATVADTVPGEAGDHDDYRLRLRQRLQGCLASRKNGARAKDLVVPVGDTFTLRFVRLWRQRWQQLVRAFSDPIADRVAPFPCAFCLDGFVPMRHVQLVAIYERPIDVEAYSIQRRKCPPALAKTTCAGLAKTFCAPICALWHLRPKSTFCSAWANSD